MTVRSITTKEDKKNEVLRLEITPQTAEENKRLLYAIGVKVPEVEYVECTFDLKGKEIEDETSL